MGGVIYNTLDFVRIVIFPLGSGGCRFLFRIRIRPPPPTPVVVYVPEYDDGKRTINVCK